MCGTADQGILQEVLQTFPDNSFIYYENTNIDINSKAFTGNTNTSFNFQITDRFGEPVDTHGVNVMMSILLYEKNNTDEIHKSELMIKNVERLFQTEQENKNIVNTISTDLPTADTSSSGNNNTVDVTIATARNIGSYFELVSQEPNKNIE